MNILEGIDTILIIYIVAALVLIVGASIWVWYIIQNIRKINK